jgi:hypothetical protein
VEELGKGTWLVRFSWIEQVDISSLQGALQEEPIDNRGLDVIILFGRVRLQDQPTTITACDSKM